MDTDELQLAVWRLFLERLKLEGDRSAAESNGDASALIAAEEALAVLPEVSTLDALRANAELISRLGAQRWIAMKVARDEGANMEQVGRELGVSRQAAWEFLQRKIEEHGGDVGDVGSHGVPAPGGRWADLERRVEQRTPVSDETWQRFLASMSEGDVVEGRVTHVVPFGSFVELDPPVPGLIARSLSTVPLEPGSTVHVRILAVDHDNRRVSLAPAHDSVG